MSHSDDQSSRDVAPDDDRSIVTIGTLQLHRQSAREQAQKEACAHMKVVMDAHGQVVRCHDCGTQVSAYWMLEQVFLQIGRARRALQAERERLAWEAKKHVHRIAARRIEEAWRGHMAPCCPHCGAAVLPEDGMGRSLANAAGERAQRAGSAGDAADA